MIFLWLNNKNKKQKQKASKMDQDGLKKHQRSISLEQILMHQLLWGPRYMKLKNRKVMHKITLRASTIAFFCHFS
jgi:hypothetical protein